jgi:hypothetical protein
MAMVFASGMRTSRLSNAHGNGIREKTMAFSTRVDQLAAHGSENTCASDEANCPQVHRSSYIHVWCLLS